MARTDTASRHVAAPAPTIFEALIDKHALEAWLPPAGMHGHFEHYDPRSGGTYRLVLAHDDPAVTHGKSTSNTDIVNATFVEIVPTERIVQDIDFTSDDPAFTGTMRMTWQLQPERGGTRVTITAENVPCGISAVDHQAGMTSSLANLAAHVEPSS